MASVSFPAHAFKRYSAPDDVPGAAPNTLSNKGSGGSQRVTRGAEMQVKFIEAVKIARESYERANNEMARGGNRAKRALTVCNALGLRKSGTGVWVPVNDWIGNIKTLSSNSDGKGILGITIGDQISVKTWNNALSDIGDRTLIDPNSALFNVVSEMKVGMKVRFSGYLKRDKTDCVDESSMTQDGSMMDPEFTMRFRQVISVERP